MLSFLLPPFLFNRVAYKVSVTDPYEDLFDIIKGSYNRGNAQGTFHFELPELAAGANYTSILTLVPKVSGLMTVARAEVRYMWLPREDLKLEEEGEEGEGGKKDKAFEDDLEEQISLSSSQDKVEIMSPEKYARVSKQRFPSVFIVALGAAVATLFPFYMYRRAASTAPTFVKDDIHKD